MRNRYLLIATIISAVLTISAVVTATQEPHIGGTFTIITGCTLAGEPQANNQPQIVYYNCDNHVGFSLLSTSPGGQRLPELLGHVVDVKVTVVR